VCFLICGEKKILDINGLVLDSCFKQTWCLSGDYEFCKDDFDVETVFRCAFGGNRSFNWSFINEENPRRRSGNFSNYGKSWKWRHRSENEYGKSTEAESDCSHSDLASYRLVLGLSASGPLKLEDVKNASVLFCFLLCVFWVLLHFLFNVF